MPEGLIEVIKMVVNLVLTSTWTRCKDKDSPSGHDFNYMYLDVDANVACRFCGKLLTKENN